HQGRLARPPVPLHVNPATAAVLAQQRRQNDLLTQHVNPGMEIVVLVNERSTHQFNTATRGRSTTGSTVDVIQDRRHRYTPTSVRMSPPLAVSGISTPVT